MITQEKYMKSLIVLGTLMLLTAAASVSTIANATEYQQLGSISQTRFSASSIADSDGFSAVQHSRKIDEFCKLKHCGFFGR